METKVNRKRKNRLAMAFLLASLALLMFGIFAQVLCEGMGYDHYLFKYLFSLIPVAFAFYLLYGAVILYPDTTSWFRVLLSLLLGATILWSVFLGLVLVNAHLQEDQFIVYKFYAWTYPKEEVQEMLDKSRITGKGDGYYTYPDEIIAGYSRDQDDLPLDVHFAFDERDQAEVVFRNYRKQRTLPILSYHYGLWVDYLFAAITVIWCIIAGAVSFQVYRWWEKVTYLICYAIIALQLILPLLGAFGIINDWCPHPFSANWMLNATLVAPQLGIMFALVKISRPSPPMMTVPDDDFWHEVIDDE